MLDSSYSDKAIYYGIAKMSKEIVKKMGHLLEGKGYYSSQYLGREYEYDKLRIIYYDTDDKSDIYVFVDEIEVLYCNFLGDEIRFVDGSWKQLIEIIYGQVPDVFNNRKIETDIKSRKIDELNVIQDFFKYYIQCDESKKEVCKIIDSDLERHNISIFKLEQCSSMRNNSTDDDMDNPYYIYAIYYNGSKVASFRANKFNLVPNLLYYVDQYVFGSWTSILQKVFLEAKTLTKQKVDNSATEIIKKLKKY